MILARGASGAMALAAVAGHAVAGGSGENAILLIDPNDPVAVRLGHYYKAARHIPDQNVIYMAPGAVNHATFRTVNLPALAGHLAAEGLEDHADYILVAPSSTFFVSAPGMLNDACSPVTRLSISGAYSTALILNDFINGAGVSTPNRYYSTANAAVAFDSNTTWSGGVPSTAGTARRYYIGGLIGYTGVRGNTPEEIIAMIDRGTAVEGTRPTGTVYLMDNTDDPDRNVRRSQYSGVRTIILNNLEGQCEILQGKLPWTRQDCLGIISGWPETDLRGANITLVPGMFGDHLTSYAATFDIPDQNKCSDWIAKGASGTAGAVEEPCNYPQKFPNTKMQAWYLQGTSLGEAYQRSMQFVPYQNLLLGDALVRPFAHIPVVTAAGLPTGVVSGTFTLTPAATTSVPRGAIASFELLIDGVVRGTAVPGGAFTVDTAGLADGWHDVRVLAYDNTTVKTSGRWAGSFVSSNRGRSAGLQASSTTGDLSSTFTFTVSASGAAVREIQLLQHGRVLATRADSGVIALPAQTLGAGPSTVQTRVIFVDGKTATSEPRSVTIAATGGAASSVPEAFAYTKNGQAGQALVVELPAKFSGDPAQLQYTVVAGPTQATILGGAGAYRILSPNANASGVDGLTFRVNSPAGGSFEARVTIRWGEFCPADFNGDGFVDFFDYDDFVGCFGGECPAGATADFNDDGFVDFFDYDQFVEAFQLGC